MISGAGLYLLIRSALGGRARVAALATLALIVPVAIVGARAWDKDVVASGAYVYAELYSKQKDLYASIHDQTHLLRGGNGGHHRRLPRGKRGHLTARTARWRRRAPATC